MTTLATPSTATVTPTFVVSKLSTTVNTGFPKYAVRVLKGEKIVWERETRNTQQIDTHKRDAANWAARKYHLTPEQILWR